MAIHETKKQTDIERRLKLLRQQIYGKGVEKLRITQIKSDSQKVRKSDVLTHRYIGIPILSDSPSTSNSFRTDTTYLYNDLLKIATLASLALGIQIILYILSSRNILNLTFF